MNDYELICLRCGEELVDGKCPKCGADRLASLEAHTKAQWKENRAIDKRLSALEAAVAKLAGRPA